MEIDKNRITLKQASTSDIEVLVEFRILFLKEIQGVPSPESEMALKHSLTKYFTKSLNNYSFISWIAEYENIPVGFSGMVVREQPGNFEVLNGRTGYILNMFTVKEFRKYGIGSLLFEKLIKEAKKRNLDKIELHATKDGDPIYRQFGFIEPHDKVLELLL